ncbi:MAG: methyltransferase family protein [Anaerolineae bacterium]|jgi:protein-S-isoprenylcysteine O-methyltransferase Ste14
MLRITRIAKDWGGTLHDLHPHLVVWIWSLLLLLQMGLAFFVFRQPMLTGLRVAGWVIWTLGSIFAIVPIFALRTGGRVPQGKSYMETTALVDTGIYAIVRHPQGGTAGILLNLALALIGQHWSLVLLAAVGAILIYLDTFSADEACIDKFGEEYVGYMQRVPRVNFVMGLLRLFAQQRAKGTEP